MAAAFGLRTRRRISGALFILLLFCVAIIFLFPLLWLLDASFRPEVDIFRVPPTILQMSIAQSVGEYTTHSFVFAFNPAGQWKALTSLGNSTLITLAGILWTLVLCSLTTYAFAFIEFRGKGVLFIIVLATMMIPNTTMIVPYYQVLRKLGLTGSRLGLIIPYGLSAYSVFLLRQYFIKIPFSLVESAKMDGATHLRILASIVAPLAKPAITTLAIIQFRAIWNDFLYPMIILKKDVLFTLPIRIQFMDSYHIDRPYDAIIAAGLVSTLVPLIFFFIFQRQFIEGLSGGVKG